MQRTFYFKTGQKNEIIDITSKVRSAVKDSGVKQGICSIYAPHATAAITINENADPEIKKDLLEALAKIIPDGKWRHDTVDGNAAAHIKSSMIGSSETIPITCGELMLGTWQDIFLCCFDGPRERRVIITIIKS